MLQFITNKMQYYRLLLRKINKGHDFLPGTYIDPRILPGFYYRVRPASGKRRPFFGGQPLKLTSIGMGYGKRLVFASDSFNHPENYMWSDSHPDGLGFEPSAVRSGMRFAVLTGQLRLG